MGGCCGEYNPEMKTCVFYVSSKSIYQRINPLTKLLATSFISTWAFITDNIYIQLILLSVVIWAYSYKATF